MGSAWDRVAQIFESALEQPADQRPAFLERACGGDVELRRDVESLLAHDGTGNTYLEAAVANAAEVAQGLHTGERIGGYEIIRELGRGGMGAVYLAVRADDTFRKQVALKIVKRGMDSDFVLARFRQERQILAALEHPAIARLYDGGATPDGRPFLVMEYVEGIPVTTFCQQQNLPLDARLRLFIQICGAVEAAHRSLVVHRDLKPSNIFVNANGEVKLLDFGIAKLLDREQTETAALTRTTMRLLTPEYASPEQILMRPISTSADIYALGLVLFEILTGERAHKLNDMSPAAWELYILRTDLPRASSIAGPFADRLTGDLDTIIGKAVRKEPERRYLSVQELRDDIVRHLNDEPISARPDTLHYRAGKFVRRHRVPVIAAGLAAIGLIGGAAIAIRQARIASENAARAERRFAQVRTLARTILFDLDGKIQNLPGSAPARESLVKTSLEYLDSLSRESSGDPGLQGELAEAYLRVASIQGGQYRANMGRTGEAVKSIDKALALHRALLQAKPGDVDVLQGYVRALLSAADLDQKVGGKNLALVEEAITHANTAVALAPDSAATYKTLADANVSAYGRYLNVDPARAMQAAVASLEPARKAARLDPAHNLVTLHTALFRTGRTYLRQGHAAKARQLFEECLETVEAILVREPLNTRMTRERAFVRQQLSRALASPLNPGGPDLAAATRRIDEAIEVVRKLEQTDQGNVLRFFDVCVMETEAIVLHSDLDPLRALRHEAAARKAIDAYLQLEPNHAYAKTVPMEINIEVSRAYEKLKRWPEVERLMTSVLAERVKRPPIQNVDYFSRRARARAELGSAASATTDAEAANSALRATPLAAIEMRDIFNVAASWSNLAATWRKLGQPQRAADAIAQRKAVFADIRRRGFQAPYLDKLEAQP